jgi:hypothetical protein
MEGETPCFNIERVHYLRHLEATKQIKNEDSLEEAVGSLKREV